MTPDTRPEIPPEIVDSHCHLDFPDFAQELPEVIARARSAGVTRMVTICTRLKNEPTVRAIAESHEGVFYAAGIHPMSAHEEPPVTVDQLIALSGHPPTGGGPATRGAGRCDRGQLDPRLSFHSGLATACEGHPTTEDGASDLIERFEP